MNYVSVYSRKSCSPCNTLKTFLTKKGIEFQNLDLDTNPELQQKVFDLTGMLIVPVVESDKGVVAGLNIPAILAIL